MQSWSLSEAETQAVKGRKQTNDVKRMNGALFMTYLQSNQKVPTETNHSLASVRLGTMGRTRG